VYAILVPDEAADGKGGWRAVGTVQHQGVKPELGTAAIGFVVHPFNTVYLFTLCYSGNQG
jgi:hypothetical protein